MEYTWNRQVIRKTTNVFVKVADWNQNGNQGRGEIRASHGAESKRLNQLLLARVERIDSQLAEYNEKHPNQITADVVSGFLADKPLARRDIYEEYISYRCYKGKPIPSIERRRKREFQLLYIP